MTNSLYYLGIDDFPGAWERWEALVMEYLYNCMDGTPGHHLVGGVRIGGKEVCLCQQSVLTMWKMNYHFYEHQFTSPPQNVCPCLRAWIRYGHSKSSIQSG